MSAPARYPPRGRRPVMQTLGAVFFGTVCAAAFLSAAYGLVVIALAILRTLS